MLTCVLQGDTIFVTLNFYDHFYDCFSFFVFILKLDFFFCLVSLSHSSQTNLSAGLIFLIIINTLYLLFWPWPNKIFSSCLESKLIFFSKF